MNLSQVIDEIREIQNPGFGLERLEHIKVEGTTQDEIVNRLSSLAELEEFDFINYEVITDGNTLIASGFGFKLK